MTTLPAGSAEVVLRGELDIATLDDARRQIEAVEAGAPPVLVLDLSGLSFVDSSGVRLALLADDRVRTAVAVVVGERQPTLMAALVVDDGVDPAEIRGRVSGKRVDAVAVDRVVADDPDLGSGRLEGLDEIERERVVVIDDEDHVSCPTRRP